jgi:hypothetical protein
MVNLFDEIVAEQPEQRCKFGKILSELDPEDRAGLEQALSSPEITQISVVNVLTRRGYAVDRDTMSKHVRGKCACFR